MFDVCLLHRCVNVLRLTLIQHRLTFYHHQWFCGEPSDLISTPPPKEKPQQRKVRYYFVLTVLGHIL